MPTTFKSSLFGFNKEDVLNYIESTTANHARELHLLQKELAQGKQDLKSAMEQIEANKAKEQELEQLSIAIGKLYLIAKSNSEKIVQDARENAEISKAESAKNIQAIEAVQAQLQALYAQLYASGSAFGEELNQMSASLSDAKEMLNQNQEDINKADEALNQMIKESTGIR